MRIINAIYFSCLGLKAAWKEPAFKQECCLAAILIPLAFWLDVSVVEKLLLIMVMINVLIIELINSAIETTINRVGHEIHPLSAAAKDLGSAAVFLALLLLLIVWGLILFS